MRITIPDDLGGGWIEIKDRRSWADSNRIASAGLRMREGLTQAEIEAAQPSDLMEIDGHGKSAIGIAVSVLKWSDGLIGAHTSMRDWLDSDDLDEDLGDFLETAVEDYYASRRRSKRGSAEAQPDAGRGAGDDEGAGAASGPRALRDSGAMAGVPA